MSSKKIGEDNKAYPSTEWDATKNSFLSSNNKISLLSDQELLKWLRSATSSTGPDLLGFTAE